jgi:hypothetical protein
MLISTPNFPFGLTFNCGVDNVFVQQNQNEASPSPPVSGNFELLNGGDFLLLNGGNLLLL